MRWWHLDEVLAIENAAFPHTAWTPEMFWSELARVPESRCYFVCVVDGQVIGYAGLMTVGADADIQTIAVAPTAQRRGTAQQLLDQLFVAARARGCTRTFLEVAADNHAARQLYERNEFEVTATRRDYYGKGRDAVMMRRLLRNATA